jgi:hypothetical protein
LLLQRNFWELSKITLQKKAQNSFSWILCFGGSKE